MAPLQLTDEASRLPRSHAVQRAATRLPRFQLMESAMSLRTVRHRNVVVAVLATLAAGAGSAAAQPDLAEKINKLKIRHSTAHYVIAGTVRQEILVDYGDHLEGGLREFEKDWGSVLKTGRKPEKRTGGAAQDKRPRDEDQSGQGASDEGQMTAGEDQRGRFKVVVFAQSSEFQEFTREFVQGRSWNTDALFIPAYDLLLVVEGNYAKSGALHEAFGQYLYRFIPNAPVWLSQGLSVRYSCGAPTKHGFEYNSPREDYFQFCQKLARRRMHIPLEVVVYAASDKFRDTSPVNQSYADIQTRDAYFAEAYILVDLLLSRPDGKRRLHGYVRDLVVANDVNLKAVTQKHFDYNTCQSLTPHWIKHIDDHLQKAGRKKDGRRS
jgi:hypothetical protein